MDENELKQDFFISDDGYINIRLKLTTEDKTEREKVVSSLMGNILGKEKFELSKHVEVTQLYFYNQNPLTVLKDLKKQVLSEIEEIFNSLIERQ